MEISLQDLEAVDDLRLLIKLSCGASYVQDGDVRLSRSTRLRLAFLANAFELWNVCKSACSRWVRTT